MTEAATTTHDHAKALAILTRILGEAGLNTATFRDNLRVYLPPDRLVESLRALRDEGGFNLTEVGGADYLGYPGRPDGLPRFEVHYVLLDQETTERVILKAGVDDPDPTLPSIVGLWLGADWMEREIFDMYGVRFEGHPDLRRILMPEEFTSYPLRKDYPLRGRGERHNFPRLTRAES